MTPSTFNSPIVSLLLPHLFIGFKDYPFPFQEWLLSCMQFIASYLADKNMSEPEVNRDIGSAEVSEGPLANPSTSLSHQEKKVDDKQLTELNGEIGYYVKKGTQFVPMTNFSDTCMGYVTESPESGSSDGFLFQVTPKNTLASGEHGEEDSQQDHRRTPSVKNRDLR